MHRRSLLFLVLAGIVISSLGILFASAMLTLQSDGNELFDQNDTPVPKPKQSHEMDEHAPCDAGYRKDTRPWGYSPNGP